MKNRLIVALAVLSLAGCVVAPAPPPYTAVPAPRAEVVPAPPGGQFVWQPGGWHWNGAQYVWIPGHYVERRPEWNHWEAGHWAARNGTWEWIPGHWV